MNKIVFIVTLLFFAFFCSPNITFAHEEILEGEVIQILDQQTNYQKILVKLSTGESIETENGNEFISSNSMYKIGDKLVLQSFENEVGSHQYVITDYVRRDELFGILVVFIFVVIAVAQFKGLTSILGMIVSYFIIFNFILPLILKGYNSVLVTIVGCAFIIPATFGISHGFSRKTIIAMFGTIITLVITGILSFMAIEATHLTGFASEEAGFLNSIFGSQVNIKGILLSGMIIATLGVLDDITISQSSIVEELKSTNSKLAEPKLFSKAMNVGRDHIASLVNTLVLVYTGASLPLLLLFLDSNKSFFEVINYELIADEIVRTLVGSLGLVLAVPITTAIAVYFHKGKH